MSFADSVAFCQLASAIGMFFQSSMRASPAERATTLLLEALQPLGPVTVTLSVIDLSLSTGSAVKVTFAVPAPPVIEPPFTLQA